MFTDNNSKDAHKRLFSNVNHGYNWKFYFIDLVNQSKQHHNHYYYLLKFQ